MCTSKHSILLVFGALAMLHVNGQITVSAGPDTILCESNLETYQLGDFVSVNGDFPPFSYSWSCEYTMLGRTFFASSFINDTAISHPTFISSFDTLSFTLEVTDDNGNKASDDLTIILSSFVYCLADCIEFIDQGGDFIAEVKALHLIMNGLIFDNFDVSLVYIVMIPGSGLGQVMEQAH